MPLPKIKKHLPLTQSKILLESMMLGDGHVTKTNNNLYYTSSEQLKDDIYRLVLQCGYSANARVPEGRKEGTTIFFKNRKQFVTTNADNYEITIIKTKLEPEINHGHCNSQNGQSEEWIDYNDKVYCLTVSTGIFLMSENGKPVFTGNSRHG